MILIVGGAWQGKLSWAAETYGFGSEELLDLAEADPVPGYLCYYHLEQWTARCENPSDYLSLFENAVVISREIGSGVVPINREERFWRERHGRFLRRLSAASEHVIRITCGLPEVLK